MFDLNKLFSEMLLLRNLEIFLFGKNSEAADIHGKQIVRFLWKAKNLITYKFTTIPEYFNYKEYIHSINLGIVENSKSLKPLKLVLNNKYKSGQEDLKIDEALDLMKNLGSENKSKICL